MKDAANNAILICVLALLVVNIDNIIGFLSSGTNRLGDELKEIINRDIEPGPLQKTYREFMGTIHSEAVKNAPPQKRKEAIDKALKKAAAGISKTVTSKAKSGAEKDMALAVEKAIGEMLEAATSDSLKDMPIKKREEMIEKALKKALAKTALISAIHKDDIFKSILRAMADTAVEAFFEDPPDDLKKTANVDKLH